MTPQSLTTVVLVGSLGRAMGRTEWQLDVKSVAEAIRAIDINTRGKLAAYLSGPARERLYRVALQRRENVIDPVEATHRSGRSTIYIMPTVRMRNSGWGKVIAGIGLIALAMTNPFGWAALSTYTVGAAGATTLGMSALAVGIAGFGVSLLLGGVSQLLTPKSQGDVTPEEQRASTTFPGNTLAVVQGGSIPLVYGHALVSPTPVSVTINNNNVSISDAGTNAGSVGAGGSAGSGPPEAGSVDSIILPGGAVQYRPRKLPP